MTIIPDIAETMQTVLTIDAEQAAKESGFVQRQSKINGPVFVQSMMFGFLSNPESTVGELVQTAEKVGITVTGSGLVQRCRLHCCAAENPVPGVPEAIDG